MYDENYTVFSSEYHKLKTLAGLVTKAESIGCFARITDITPKTDEQLSELRRLGYNSITVGVEAGDDEALSFMHKGFGTKEIIDLLAFMQHLFGYRESLCQTKEIHLRMNIGSLPAIMKLDKALVERAVMNVVGNGFDYSPQGGTLYVDVKSKDTGGAKVILKIPC